MSISLENVQSQPFYNILKQVVEQFKVKINIYRLQTGVNRDIKDKMISSSNPEDVREKYTYSMFELDNPKSDKPQPKPVTTSFELIITEIPEISHNQEWKRFLEGDEVFTNLYSLISVISLLPGGGKWTSLIQRLHQRFFTPKYSTGMNPNSETISIKQLYDSRLFNLTGIEHNIITILTYLQYTSLNSPNPVKPKEPLYDKGGTKESNSSNLKNHLFLTQLNIVDSALYTMSSVTVESLLNLEQKLLSNFLTGTKQLSIDNYIFTVDIPLLSYSSPFLVLKDISYSFNEIICDNTITVNNTIGKYIPKSVELQMSFEPFMPRYISRNTKINHIDYSNRFYIEV